MRKLGWGRWKSGGFKLHTVRTDSKKKSAWSNHRQALSRTTDRQGDQKQPQMYAQSGNRDTATHKVRQVKCVHSQTTNTGRHKIRSQIDSQIRYTHSITVGQGVRTHGQATSTGRTEMHSSTPGPQTHSRQETHIGSQADKENLHTVRPQTQTGTKSSL